MTGGNVHGYVADGFERVRQAFEQNFASEGEVGAAFAAYRDGNLVVDLWGGVTGAEPASAGLWQADTLTGIFSGSKGLVAVCLLKLVERGLLDLDAPVARYWPEFAAAGKGAITVADVVSHRAGLPGFVQKTTLEDVLDDRGSAAKLAGQAPARQISGVVCYHPFTYGWLCGEIVRRVDGRSIGQFFAGEVAEPLSLELWIGLPEEKERRVSTLQLAAGWNTSPSVGAADEPGSLAWTVRRNPPLLSEESFPWNTPEYHRAEIPGAGAIGTARSIARFYACLAEDGALDDVRLLAPATVELARRELSRGHEPLLDIPMVFACGVQLQTGVRPFGPPDQAFGHNGAGGSMHGTWPAERVSYSYVMNYMRNDEKIDPRGTALLAALHASVRSQPVHETL